MLPQDLSDHTILLVDDERPNLELIERFLRRKYKRIISAQDSEHALWVLKSESVGLVIADQRMPHIEGTDLLRHARELQPSAVRVLMTGYGDIETLTAAINAAQVFQVITKPIDFKMLDLLVRRGLEALEAQVRERNMFEAFVNASVNAIEQRDPSTAGHSYRVAVLTTRLAQAVDKITEGPLADVRFSKEDLEQLKFASLLHDFGKIGVPEAILTKSHKLPPGRRELLLQRIEHALGTGKIDEVHARRLHEVVMLLNNPTISSSKHLQELELLEKSGLLADEDAAYLRIEMGSLSPQEREVIQSHVQGTVAFLKQIPWPRRLSRIAEIAGAHHEKLDGTGYPSNTASISVEARMLTICDIFDALIARDRPYKTAQPQDRALELLDSLCKRGELDQHLFDVFIKARVFRFAKDGSRGYRMS
jgi:response regulator RpfG family c-di-GMP phosphodiesterase